MMLCDVVFLSLSLLFASFKIQSIFGIMWHAYEKIQLLLIYWEKNIERRGANYELDWILLVNRMNWMKWILSGTKRTFCVRGRKSKVLNSFSFCHAHKIPIFYSIDLKMCFSLERTLFASSRNISKSKLRLFISYAYQRIVNEMNKFQEEIKSRLT